MPNTLACIFMFVGKPYNDTWSWDDRIQICLKLATRDGTMVPNLVLSKKGEEKLERTIPLWKNARSLRPSQRYICPLQCDWAPFPIPQLLQAIFYVKKPNDRTKSMRKLTWYLVLRQLPTSVNKGLVLLSQNGLKFPIRVLRASMLNEQNFRLASSTHILAFSNSLHSGEGTEINLERNVIPQSAASTA